MIKIFLINIILAVVNLNAVESSMKLYGVDLSSGIICVQFNALNFNSGFVIYKNHTVDSSNNNTHLSGIQLKITETKYPHLNSVNLEFLSDNHRNRFDFFETGVSPPFAAYS